MSPRRTCYEQTDKLATEGYDEHIDPETGNEYYVDRETGEYVNAITVKVPEGSTVTTPQQREAYKKYKEKEQQLYIARKSRENLRDKFTFVSCDAQLRKLQPTAAVRLAVLSTYANYDTGRLMYHRKPMALSAMAKVLKIGERSTRRFLKKVSDFLQIDEDGSYVLSTDYFLKGRLDKRRLRGKRYQQLYDDALRQIYNAVSPEQYGYLGYAFQMLEYLNVEYNFLCYNPEEQVLSEVVPLSCEDYCKLIGYDYSNFARMKKAYSKLSVDIDGRPEAFCSFVDNGHSTRIFVNPHIVYAGSQYDKVEILGEFCKA